MYSEKVTVVNKSGIHARPAMMFVQGAVKFSSNITFGKSESSERKNAKSVISVMSVGAKLGDEIEIIADGMDETEAVTALVKIVEAGLGE